MTDTASPANRSFWSIVGQAAGRPETFSSKTGAGLGLSIFAVIVAAVFAPPLAAAAAALVATVIVGARLGSWCGWVFGLVVGFVATFVHAGRLLPDDTIAQVTATILACANFAVLGLLAGRVRELSDETTLIAELDRMTGLVNRTGFIRRMEAEANRSRRSSWPIAIGFLDLDRFKLLNDTRGHAAGDAALKLIGRTLATNVRNYDTAARLGGDEFAVLWPVQSAAGAETAGRRLHETLIRVAAEQGYDLGVSLGLAVFEAIPEDAAELLARADELMYEAKQTGRGRVVMRTYRDATGARETDERR